MCATQKNHSNKMLFNTWKLSVKLFLIQLTFSSVYGALVPIITDLNSNPSWNATYTDTLKKVLMMNYDKYARPAQHFNETVISVGMTVTHIDLDELKSLLTVNAMVRMEWIDEKLKWNASDYGGLKTIHVAGHEIWQPDVVCYNSATGNSLDHYGSTYLLVQQNGTVLWVPPSQFTVFCNLDLTRWPFDTQTCIVKLGSWTHHGYQINLQLAGNSVQTLLINPNTQWKIASTSVERNVVKYDCCEEPYMDVTFSFTLERDSPMYKAIIVTPALVIIFNILSVFWLPPKAGEKLLLNGCNGIIITIFLLYFSNKLPSLATNTPVIVHFYSNALFLSCVSTIIAVIVIKIARTEHSKSLPWLLKRGLTSRLGQILGIGYNFNSVSVTHRVNAEELRENQSVVLDDHTTSDDRQMLAGSLKSSRHDWVKFAIAIDRICFLLYTIIFIILAIVYSF